MTDKSFIIEKAIAVLLTIWGGLLLYGCIISMKTLFDFNLVSKLSFVKFFLQYHFIFILPVLTIVGGIFLLLDKKIGWTISMVALLLNGLLFLIPIEKGKSLLTDDIFLWAILLLIIFSITMIYVLTLPVHRNKYGVTRKTWWTISLITFVILVDKALLYFTS